MRKDVICLTVFALLFSAHTAFAGVVTGSVKFTGTKPELEQIHMDADPVCASLHPEPFYSEEVVVNDNGTLRNVFVYVKEGLEGQTFPVPEAPVTIDQKGCQYHPHVFGIQVGQTLEII